MKKIAFNTPTNKVASLSALVIACSVLMVSLIAGCSKSDSSHQGESIAVVDGKSISQTAFNSYLALKRIDNEASPRLDKAKEEYIEREALANAIEKTQYLDEHKIAAELNEFKKQMLISRYFDKYLQENISEQGLKNYYSNNPEQFQTKKVKVAHILIRIRPKMSEIEKQAKRSRAHEAYSLLMTGVEFSEVVKDYSDDTVSVKKGGELGWLQEGSIEPAFSKQVFGMSVDDISEPFESSFGFHIVKLLEGPQVVNKAFEQVQGDIRYRMRADAKKAEMQRLQQSISIERVN